MKSRWTSAVLTLVLTLALASCSKPAAPTAAVTASGECPKCGTLVPGGLAFWDGHDSNGARVGEAEYRARCPNCKASLSSRSGPDAGNRIGWRIAERFIKDGFYVCAFCGKTNEYATNACPDGACGGCLPADWPASTEPPVAKGSFQVNSDHVCQKREFILDVSLAFAVTSTAVAGAALAIFRNRRPKRP